MKNKDNIEKISQNIQPREITEEMRESYLSYAMSVIISRALPDVRDGLKPVHRRILYAMRELGLTHSAKFRKSATIVGEVLGKYHPHGDAAVYDSMVRLAQDFSLRDPLVEGQGNFGSIDNDPAAAYRYTEARLTPVAEEMLADIEKETVDFQPNYNGEYQEPKVLPAKIPQLLLNGTMGIAVGMATNIPPHNLIELCDAAVALIDDPKSTAEDLAKIVKGPDFPTGGSIFNQKEIAQAYAIGRGPVVMRGEMEIIEKKNRQFQIVVSEIPYQVNKAALVEHIVELVQNKKLEGIRNLRDESDREGLRVVIDLKTDAQPQRVLNSLYKHTDLQKTFHINMLALVDGIQPQVLSLKSVLEYFIKHRREIVTRRARFDLKKAADRAHILEGLKKALDHIDAIIKTIKSSPDREAAHGNLCKKFKLTAVQATAILEMKLQTLAGLERKKIEEELKEKKALIKELELLLKTPKKIMDSIKKELLEIKEKYGTPRRTRVSAGAIKEITVEEMVPQEKTIVILTHDGYIKRLKPETYKTQQRGGKGIIGMATKEEDAVEHFILTDTHDNLLFFTNSGKVFQTKAYEIPEGTRTAKGKSIVNFLSLAQTETITSILNYADKIAENKFNYLFMATKNGIIKKTALEDFKSVRRNGLIALKLKKDDVLRAVLPTSGQDEIILTSGNGQAVRFSEKDARPMGRNAAGTKGMRLKKQDEVNGACVIAAENKDDNLLIIMENGYGKQTPLKEYKKQKRGGSGIKTAKITEKTGKIVSAKILGKDVSELIAISKKGQVIRTTLETISALGRATQGVRIMKLESGDKVASVTCL